MHYFGYKLVTLSTIDGVPIAYDLVPANTDERLAAETVLSAVSNCDVFCDKGFIGEEWQTEQLVIQGNRIWTPARVNQKIQNPKGFDRWLNTLRERIEGVFNEIQNTGRNLERLLRKTFFHLNTFFQFRPDSSLILAAFLGSHRILIGQSRF